MNELFRELRAACSAPIWSKAVELVRQSAVSGVSADDDEIVCRVRVQNQAVAPTVRLYPDDEEWDCDCGTSADACEHAAAAVIAVRRARERGETLPTAGGRDSRLQYRFTRSNQTLALERFLLRGDDASRLELSLSTLLGTSPDQCSVVPSAADLYVDRVLAHRYSGPLPAGLVKGVVQQLVDAADVQLDGKSVKVSSEHLSPRAYLAADGAGFVVVLERPVGIDEVVGPDVVRRGDVLFVLDHTDLTGQHLERLPSRRRYEGATVVTLLTEVLPGLQARFDVDVRTDRLPRIDRGLKPRVELDVSQVGHSVSVLPTLVYGNPPTARVDAGQLVHLRGGVPVRDENAERRAADRLRDELGLLVGHRRHLEGEAALHFVDRLGRWKGSVKGDTQATFVSASPLEPHLSTEGRSFDLSFSTGDGARQASGEAVVAAWQQGRAVVPLDGGGWAPLPAGWLSEHGHLVAGLLRAREDGSPDVKPHALPALAELCDAFEEVDRPDLAPMRALLESHDGLPPPSLPSDLTADLRPYQHEGIRWLCFLRDAGMGATLADDMGLGKTLQALCALKGRTLVVCPTSVLHNWRRELERFRPSLTAHVFHGPKRSLEPGADVTLTTYALLRIDQALLAGERWDTVVLDEAQMIKNPTSQVARAAHSLEAGFRMTLSGTPVENRLEELWSQLHFTNRGLLGTKQAFAASFADAIEGGDASRAKALRRLIKPFVLRRHKKDVLSDLPPRTDATLMCELPADERAVYDAVRAATRDDVLERLAAGGNTIEVLELLLRLRQAACHPSLVPGQSAESSTKVRTLLASLEDVVADEHKALVFSQWTGLLDLIEPHLEREGIAFERLDGSTRDREGVVARFQSEDGPPVMLLSLKAGGIGLNLTAADHVFLMDPWWNPAVEEQAADRAHRIGQDRPVMVYRLVTEDTVEERILALQASKRAIADAALGESAGATRLTRDDLLALLG